MLDATAGEALARAYGLGGAAVLDGPVARGEMGQVWKLTTDAGRFAIKDNFTAQSDVDASADADFQDAVRASGVVMPAVVRTTSGAVLAEIAGRQVRVYEWVDVHERDRCLDPELVGALLASIHRVAMPTSQPFDDWYAEPVGAERWVALVDDLERAGASFSADLRSLLPELAAVEALIERRPATQWCHNDFWADNVLRMPTGGVVVLDWENSGPGAPAQELGVALFEFGSGDAGRMRSLATSYALAGGSGRITEPADLTQLVAQLHHIEEVACRRWLASTTPAERTRNERWAREFIDEPVTRATLDLILAVCNGI